MGRKKRNLTAYSPAHPTDLTLFVPLTISRGSFVKRGTCPLDLAKLLSMGDNAKMSQCAINVNKTHP
jgi:hypothetical protein